MMRSNSEDKNPLRVAFNSLKDTLVFYALIADLVAFGAVAILVISSVVPLWPFAAIIIVTILVATLIAIIISYVQVLLSAQRVQQELAKKNEELHHRPDRKEYKQAQLKNQFSDFLNGCKNLNEFFDFLKQNVSPLLIDEFGIARTAVITTEVLPTSNAETVSQELLFSYPKTKMAKILNRFDTNQAEFIILGDKKPIRVVQGNDFIAHYIPLQDQTTDTIWYVFSYHIVNRLEANVAADYLYGPLMGELKVALEKIRQRTEFFTLEKRVKLLEQKLAQASKVKLKHLCAVLNLKIDGTAVIENEEDFLTSEIAHIYQIMKEQKKYLEEAFNPKRAKLDSPIVVAGGTYNLSLIPVLVNRRVVRVIFVYDSVEGHTLLPNQIQWHGLYRLAGQLYSETIRDEVTDLVNSSYFNWRLEQIIISSAATNLLGLIVIEPAEYSSWQELDESGYMVLQKIAQILAQWTGKKGEAEETLIARYEGGIFFVATRVDSEADARGQANWIRELIIDKLSEIQHAQILINIGVLVFRCDYEDPSDARASLQNLRFQGLKALKAARQTAEGISVISMDL